MPDIKILVVEDEEVVAFDIDTTLTDLGYEVPAAVAYDEEAIEQASKIQPDLVLIDIRLKGKIDGIEAAEEISKRFQIPVVYLTTLPNLSSFIGIIAAPLIHQLPIGL